MIGVCAIVLAAFMAAGATAACEKMIYSSDGDSHSGQRFITKEWIWSDGASTTTFTAHGPPEQVNSLDPQNGIIECPDCQLASSQKLSRGDETSSD